MIDLKRPFSDGTYALEMDVLSLLARLAASVPPPRLHCVQSLRFAGFAGSVASQEGMGGERVGAPTLSPPINNDSLQWRARARLSVAVTGHTAAA
jgi:hypothetical protein